MTQQIDRINTDGQRAAGNRYQRDDRAPINRRFPGATSNGLSDARAKDGRNDGGVSGGGGNRGGGGGRANRDDDNGRGRGKRSRRGFGDRR